MRHSTTSDTTSELLKNKGRKDTLRTEQLRRQIGEMKLSQFTVVDLEVLLAYLGYSGGTYFPHMQAKELLEKKLKKLKKAKKKRTRNRPF